MMRGTFANIRIKNEMVPGVEGGMTTYGGETMPIYDAAMKHKVDGTPLVVVLGQVVRRGGGGRDLGRDGRVAALGDQASGAGRVVRRLDGPGSRAEEWVGLGERLGDRVDALDGLEPRTGKRQEGQPNRDRHLADDGQLELVEKVEVLVKALTVAVQGGLDQDRLLLLPTRPQPLDELAQGLHPGELVQQDVEELELKLCDKLEEKMKGACLAWGPLRP